MNFLLLVFCVYLTEYFSFSNGVKTADDERALEDLYGINFYRRSPCSPPCRGSYFCQNCM